MKLRILAILAVFVAALLTSACGQRGPLKLPEKLPDTPKSAWILGLR